MMRGARGSFLNTFASTAPKSVSHGWVGGGGVDRYIKQTHRVIKAHRATDGWIKVVTRGHFACRPCFLQGLFIFLAKREKWYVLQAKRDIFASESDMLRKRSVLCSLRERWGIFLLRAKNKLIKNLVKYKPKAWQKDKASRFPVEKRLH